MISHAASRSSRRALVAAILIGVLSVASEAYGTLTAMPTVASHFGHLELYDWAFTLFMTAQVFGIVLAGRACDRIGVLVPLITGFLLFAAGLAGAGAARSMDVLLAMRLIQGLGGGFLNVALMVLVGRFFSDEERPRIMALLSFCWVLPSFVGPPVAAFVTDHFGWHWVFWGLIPVLAAGLVVGGPPMHEVARSDRAQRSRGKYSNAAPGTGAGSAGQVPIWAAGAAAAGAALIQYAGHRLDRIATAAALAGVLALAVSVPAIMPRGFLRAAPGLPSVIGSRGLATGAFMTSETYLILVLTQAHGLSLHAVGFMLSAGAVGWSVGSWVQARPRLGLRRDQIIMLGAAVNLLGVVGMFCCAVLLVLPVALMIACYAVSGFGMGLLVSSTSLAVMTLSRPAQLGRWTSSLQVCEGLGNSLVVGLAGSVYATLHLGQHWSTVFGAVYLVPTIVAVVCLVVSVRVGPVHDTTSGTGIHLSGD
ncbi:MFS transporter [Propionibacterium sp.]|uniref:MFS transporter n=1 Tax=Propionibacterium sp. TaxID=1977903 RepID=UPI0039ECCEDD